MRASDICRRTGITALAVVLVAMAVAAVAAVAAIDFTGHWTGTGTEKRQAPTPLVADLTSSGKKLTGTVSVAQDGQTLTCPVTGKQRGKKHVKASLGPCKIVLQGAFDAATDTITGHFVRHGRHKVHTGTFTLTRVASPSGAFLD